MDTSWSCSLWVQTRPSNKSSVTSSRCRRSWRNSTDVTHNALHKTRDRWPLDLALLALIKQLIKSDYMISTPFFSPPSLQSGILQLVVKGQLEQSSDKDETEETRFITYLIHFPISLNIMPKYNFGKKNIVGYLHCVQIAVRYQRQDIWVTCAYKNMKCILSINVFFCRLVYIYWNCTYWRLIWDILLWIHLVNIPN